MESRKIIDILRGTIDPALRQQAEDELTKVMAPKMHEPYFCSFCNFLAYLGLLGEVVGIVGIGGSGVTVGVVEWLWWLWWLW